MVPHAEFGLAVEHETATTTAATMAPGTANTIANSTLGANPMSFRRPRASTIFPLCYVGGSACVAVYELDCHIVGSNET